jgi:enediyne biosynthesis protein E4
VHRFRRRAVVAGLGALALAAPTALFTAPPLPFEEIPPARSGIRWKHDNAFSPQRYLPESLGPGVAFVDYDDDGWMDVFLVDSGRCDFYRPSTKPRNGLYRNNRDGTFTDVTDAAGVAGGDSFGMGVAAGDYDNDGYPDLFVTAYGRCTLYRNSRSGTFADVTAAAGVTTPGWTTSAVWFDYDGDGLLDLFVCSFVQYTRESQALCLRARGGRPGYCIPRMFPPTASFLYKNNGDGTFRNVSQETRLAARLGKALGAVATDINNDGRMDLFVANDTVENFLFASRRAQIWEDIGLSAQVAVSTDGWPRSGMGVDSADVDGDGWQDLFVANIDREMFALYRNTGYGMFDDLSFGGEIGRATYYLSGWGLKFLDFDNDGALDLILANGHPDDTVSDGSPKVRYRQPMLLFQQKDGQFRNVSSQAGPAFRGEHSARGLAIGDYNNDGGPDVLVGVNGGEPLLLKNEAGSGNHWLGLRLRGVKTNRDGVGATITWEAGGVKRSRLKTAGGSYLSAHDPREILGLGTAGRADWVEVRWPAPSGLVERYSGLASDRYATLVEGAGELVAGRSTRAVGAVDQRPVSQSLATPSTVTRAPRPLSTTDMVPIRAFDGLTQSAAGPSPRAMPTTRPRPE